MVSASNESSCWNENERGLESASVEQPMNYTSEKIELQNL